MSIWSSIEGRLIVKNRELALELEANSVPKPIREDSDIKLIPNQYFKGSEGGCRFCVYGNPDHVILSFEGNLRDCNAIEPLQSAFFNLIRDTKGQGFADIEINGDRWIFENYGTRNLETGELDNEILKVSFTYCPLKTFKLKTEVGL